MDEPTANTSFQQCCLLISRSGYSTLMDAMVLGTPLACIPTPGQTEQEYLSKRLAEKGWSVSMEQEHFNLEALISKADGSNISRKRCPDLVFIYIKPLAVHRKKQDLNYENST